MERDAQSLHQQLPPHTRGTQLAPGTPPGISRHPFGPQGDPCDAQVCQCTGGSPALARERRLPAPSAAAVINATE